MSQPLNILAGETSLIGKRLGRKQRATVWPLNKPKRPWKVRAPPTRRKARKRPPQRAQDPNVPSVVLDTEGGPDWHMT